LAAQETFFANRNGSLIVRSKPPNYYVIVSILGYLQRTSRDNGLPTPLHIHLISSAIQELNTGIEFVVAIVRYE
jgi:hypothetical protein